MDYMFESQFISITKKKVVTKGVIIKGVYCIEEGLLSKASLTFSVELQGWLPHGLCSKISGRTMPALLSIK
jgi:uncharacterized membrane protein